MNTISNDPIVEEIHAIRARHAAECNYDLKAMFEDILQHQKDSGRTYMALMSRLHYLSLLYVRTR